MAHLEEDSPVHEHDEADVVGLVVPGHVVAVTILPRDLVLNGPLGGLPPALAHVSCTGLREGMSVQLTQHKITTG